MFHSRRQFLKIFAVGAATSTLAGKRWMQTYAAEVPCPPLPNVGSLKVTFSQYPVLQTDFSSIRLGVNPMLGDSPYGRFYPVLINRGEGGVFYALNSECTHAGCVVPPYDEFNGGSRCPCHFSVYGVDGTVLQGPAERDLTRYQITFDGVETLTVHIPDLGYCVSGAVVHDGSRFQLDFTAFQRVEYEVRFRPTLNAETDWVVVPFSLTPDGPADQQSYTGGIDDAPVSLFVDRTTPAGFYAVTIKVLDLT